MEKVIDRLETTMNDTGNIAKRIAGVENFLCDMEEESQNQTYRITVLIDSVQHILDDLQQRCIDKLSGVIADMEGGAA